MTTNEKVARRKRSLLELATELGNVRKACRVMGYSRQLPDLWRRLAARPAAWRAARTRIGWQPRSGRQSSTMPLPILATAACGVAQELMLRGLQVSSGGVRGVWQRPGLPTKHERLLRLEQATAERTLELSDEQIRLLERFSPEFRERHIPGALVAVDTFFIGVL